MIDETCRPRWAWLLGSLASIVALALSCSANDTPSPGEDDEGGGGSSQGGAAGVNGGVGPTGGAPPNGGVSGSVGPGGTGSGGVSGAQPTGGVGPTGGASGAAGAPGGVGGTPPTGGSSGDAGASGTGGMPGLLGPIQRGNQFVLEFGDLFFAVDPAGARVVDVHLTGGMNLLTGPSINATNYGSTFWTSPQATWNWPPVPEIDSGAYMPTVAAAGVSFLGATATRVPVRVNKTFTADFARTAVVIDYAVQAPAAAQMVAPWEITRVFKRGLTFWPTGTAPRAGSMPILPTTTGAGCTWHEASAASTEGKLFANASAGWLAHVDGDIVIVKKFPDIQASMAAPNEDEIEIYTGTGDYMEVEQQGAYQAVASGANFTWQVTWFVRRLPSGVTPTMGNQQLVSFVQSLVQ